VVRDLGLSILEIVAENDMIVLFSCHSNGLIGLKIEASPFHALNHPE
jgi:hypothetical protein